MKLLWLPALCLPFFTSPDSDVEAYRIFVLKRQAEGLVVEPFEV